MHHLDLTLTTVAENLALDEAFLLEADAGHGGEVLRFWEWPSLAVILGAGGRLAEDVDEAACLADKVPVFRRSSGGGTVLLGPGCLLYTLVLSYERGPALAEVVPSYRFILGLIGDALRDVAPGIEMAGSSDLAVGGLKVSGNSQQRKRCQVLHHGTLLYAFDIGNIGRYLRLPSKQPSYRQGRDHAAFLTNLALGPVELRGRLRALWRAEQELTSWPEAATRRLVDDKYSRPEWVRRR